MFAAATVMGLVEQHLTTTPPSPSGRTGREVPRKLESLVLACLEKRRELRPESAEDLLARLEALDDVAPWTAADARSWWTAHGRAAPGEPAPAHRVHGSHTLAVNLAGRAGLAPAP